jgi:hypothetical protein
MANGGVMVASMKERAAEGVINDVGIEERK